ncbi:TonB-dependent receptor [Pseudomonas sp. PDM16]|uniref:TonB-dependent receptor n=1 Tax=Pseudomonas sp. PDM16 TaxID=2769292 RepID=UPI00298D59C8|nr:TonB-dependent receptor plug domain-containing protein [Pseudomonas sp. PDM16]
MSPHNLRFSLRPLALAIPLALSAGLGLWPAGLVHAEQQLIRYDIPAGPLASQLNRFAAQSGIYLAGDAALTTGKTSQALHGSYGVEQALQILLDDSGLTAQAIGNGRYELNLAVDQSSTLQLGATTVSGRQENAWGQVDGYVATRSGSGTKTDTPISEIPQTINVVTADEISARGATSIAQALNYTPGVSSSGFTQSHMLADEMSSRGFAPAPLYLDGAYLPYAGSLGGAPQIEPYSLERVEVLKGPA